MGPVPLTCDPVTPTLHTVILSETRRQPSAVEGPLISKPTIGLKRNFNKQAASEERQRCDRSAIFFQTVATLAAAVRYRGTGRDGHRRSISQMISFAKRIASEIAVIVAGILGALEY